MAFREMALRRLQISIMAHEDEINRALRLDLGKAHRKRICVKPAWC